MAQWKYCKGHIMFKTLRAIMFGEPNGLALATHSMPQDDPTPHCSAAPGTLFDDKPIHDLLDPGNPIGLTSVLSPLSPYSPIWSDRADP